MRPFLLLLIGLCLVFAWSAHAQSTITLTPSDFFIQNYDTTLNEQLVNVPISFPDQTYVASQLNALQLRNAQGGLDTQIVPTSYYKTENGSGQPYVKTAIARVLFSSGPASGNTPAPAQIFTLQNTNPQTAWTLDQRVEFLLRNVNGNALTVTAYDILGNPYQTILDIDGYGSKCATAGQYGSGFPSNCVKLIEDGPVTKVWEIHKMNEAPTNCTTAPCLSHLFSNVFYITAIKGKDYVLVDHTLVNSFNFDEVQVTSLTAGPSDTSPTGGWAYSIWQNGLIFYRAAEIAVQTPTSANTIFVADLPHLNPSRVDIASGNTTQYSIMPLNGQQLLSASPYFEGPDPAVIPQQSNFIGGGQALLSRVVVSFGAAITKHPVRDVKVDSGQSLARWNNTKPSYFLPEIPDPDAIDPTFSGSDFKTDADAYIAKTNTLSGTTGGGNNRRFGGFGLPRDQGTAGYGGSYISEPEEFLKYFLSCDSGKSGCKRNYAETFRLRGYGASSVTNHFVGYRSEKHPESNLNYYRSPAIEGGSPANGTIGCGGTSSNKDLLGFCKVGAVPTVHRTDMFGNPASTYIQTTSTGAGSYNRTMHHWWTMTEPTHMSASGLYYWMLTGDYATLYLERNRIDTISSAVRFSQAKLLNYPTTRGRGRYAKSIAFLYSIGHDAADRINANTIIQIIDRRSNKQAEGAAGTSVVSGDYYPVKYWADKVTEAGSVGQYVATFQYFLLAQGVTALYFDVLKSADAEYTTVKNLVRDNYYYIDTYGSKTPYEVRNRTPTLNNSAANLNEGSGGLNITHLYTDNSNDPGQTAYSKYDQEADVQHHPGLCGGMLVISDIRRTDPSYVPEFSQYFTDFKDFFDRAWVHPVAQNKFDGGISGGTTFGVGIPWITDDLICGLAYFMGVPAGNGAGYVNGVYQSSVATACPDADGDGVTTCAGDCNDNPAAGGASVNPNKTESSCTNNVDDNCNLLKDCNDPVCSANAACPAATAAFCGNGRLDAGEQCDVVPGSFPAGAGTGVNNCGIPPSSSPPLSPAYMDGAAPDATGYCIPAFVSLVQGCQCAGSLQTFFLNSISPPTILDNAGATSFVLVGGGMTSSNQVQFIKEGQANVTITKAISNVTCSTSCTGNVSLTASEISTTLGVGNHRVRLFDGSSLTNELTLKIVSSTAISLSSISPNAVVTGATTPLLTAAGTNFQNGDVLEFTGNSGNVVNATTTFASPNLTTILTTGQLTTLGVGAGTVRVKRGTSTFSNTVPFTVNSTTGLSLSSVNPDTFVIDQDYTNIILTGNNIQSGDRAFFTGQGGATAHTVTSNFTATTITTSITANLLQILGAGTGQLSIHRSTPDTYSNTIPFTIVPSAGGPVVTLTSTDTAAAESGTPATNTGSYTLTRTGAITASLPVTITMTGTATNGGDYTTISTTQTIPINSATLNVTLTPIDDASIESTETAIMTVVAGTGYTVGTPSAVTVNIVDNDSPPGPTLTQVNPGTIAYNLLAPLVLTGTNFSTPSTVTLGAVGNQVVFNNVTPTQNGTQINITLSAAQTQTLNTASSTQAATHNVFVTSNAQNSNAQPLTVTPPILNSVSPASFEYNTNPTIDLDTDYYGASPIVRVGGISFTPTTPVAGTLRIAPSLNQVNTIWGVGNFIAEVENSTKISNTKTITITDPLPTLVQVNPTTVTWNTANTITLTGTKFQSPTAVYAGSKVEVGTITGITPAAFTGNTQLQFSFSAAQTKTLGVGTYQIHVVNGSQTSAATNQTLTIAEATPTLNPIAASIPAGQDNSIVLSGANIQTYVEVLVGGLPPKTPIQGTVTETGLTFNLSAGEIVTLGGAGTYPVIIRNDPTHFSAPQNLTITPSTGSSAPNTFILTSISGAVPGTVSVDWTSAGGVPAPQYRVVGIALSVLQTIGNGDSIIDAGEINNTALPWAYNQTDPTKPFVFTGSENTEYCFAGKAFNNLGEGYSNTSCALTTSSNTAPSPFTLDASAGTSPGALTISWNDAGGNPTPRYRLKGILRSDPIAADGIIDNAEFDNPPAGTVWAVNADETSPYAFAGTPDTEYCFAAKARNSQGVSYSSTDCETTPDDAPAPPSTPAPPAPPSSGGGSPGGGGDGGNTGGGTNSGGTGGNLTCTPTLELCDGIDNDCDSQIDEGCAGVDAPTCFNGVRDPGELRKDCGGVCSRLCYPSTPPSYFTFISSLASPMLIVFEWIARLFQW